MCHPTVMAILLSVEKQERKQIILISNHSLSEYGH